MPPLVVFGGTFDPVHLGHLRVAWEVAELLDAHVHFIPSASPPHRPAPIATPAQRLAMLRIALCGQTHLHLDERELHREGPSYSVDTLAELRAEIGPLRSLIVLLGADAFAGLSTWHCWRDIFALAHIGVLTRPGHGHALPPELASEVHLRQISWPTLKTQAAGGICKIAVTPLEISASQIRADIAGGREPRFLLPEAFFNNPDLLAPYRARPS